MRAIDLTGKDFVNLHVEKFIESRQVRERKRRIYLCKCTRCGNFKEISGDDLTRKAVKSCGCLRERRGSENPKWKGFGEISGEFWSLIKDNYKKTNKFYPRRKNIEFDLTIEEAWGLFIKQNRCCALSGVVINFGINKTASLDRINSFEGYHLSNVQWIHKDLNIMKQSYSQDIFIEWCKRVTNNRKNINVN